MQDELTPALPSLAELREAHSITQAQLAKITGLSKMWISNAERGKPISASAARAICLVFSRRPSQVSGLNITRRTYVRKRVG